MIRVLAMLLLCVDMAYAATVNNVRIWPSPDSTRVVLDLDAEVEYNLLTLSDPERVVLDLKQSRIKVDVDKLSLKETPLTSMRAAPRNGSDLRIVLDLSRKLKPRSFTLPPNKQYGHRLVLDLLNPQQVSEKTLEERARALRQEPGRPVVIAIDAGHGGEDPGALGPRGLREKDVVLEVAKELYRLLEKEPGFRPVLIRTGDYYIPLRERTRKARDQGADLFISIHADAFRDKRARGASVWTLSERGASSELGRWLAGQENSADLIGGVGALGSDEKDETLVGVLLDMSMSRVIGDSREIGSTVLGNMGKVARLHKGHVEQAGFVVLKSPDIPSILVETGFISNPREARLLSQSSHRRKLAEAIYRGVVDHFRRKPPALTWLAQQKARSEARSYRVSKGDTLSVIASREGVSVEALRRANGLKNDLIRVGQVLTIPAS